MMELRYRWAAIAVALLVGGMGCQRSGEGPAGPLTQDGAEAEQSHKRLMASETQGATVQAAQAPDAAAPKAAASAAIPAKVVPPSAPKKLASKGFQPVPLIETSGSASRPLPYRVVEPASAEGDTPIVIALHGRGDHARSFSGLARRIGLPVRTAVAEAPFPYGPPGPARQWFDLKSQGVAGIDAQVANVVALAKVLHARWPDAPKPWIYGFSQGAMLALAALAAHPDAFGGIVALSGDLRTTEGHRIATLPVPILLTTGSRDRVITPQATGAAEETLRALGHHPELFTFAGAHEIPDAVVRKMRAFLTHHLKLGAVGTDPAKEPVTPELKPSVRTPTP